MKNRYIGVLAAVLAMATVLAGCATTTNVRFNTSEEGASVAIDGEKIGTTPVLYRMSNAIWEDAEIKITKPGFKDLYTGAKKEVKAVNVVGTLFLGLPILWVYGPKPNQYFELMPAAE